MIRCFSRPRCALALFGMSALIVLSTAGLIHSAQHRPTKSNIISSATFNPPSPSNLLEKTPVSVSFSYFILNSEGARIIAIPQSGGTIPPHTNGGSALLAAGSGSSSTFCFPNTAPILIDGIELRMYTPDFSKVLFSKVFPCHFSYDAFRVTQVQVSVNPPSHTGACPHTFNFTGLITTNGAGTVQYRWVRSDGATGPVETVIFREAGNKPVLSSWQIGRTFSGWKKLEILNPNPLLSNQVNFTLNCQ